MSNYFPPAGRANTATDETNLIGGRVLNQGHMLARHACRLANRERCTADPLPSPMTLTTHYLLQPPWHFLTTERNHYNVEESNYCPDYQ
jgi:hypothetical protein